MVVVGTVLYAFALSMIVGAVFFTASAGAAPTEVAATGVSAAALVVESLAVVLAAAVPSVVLARGERSSPRWWTTLLAGLVTSAAFWSRAIASARLDGDWTWLYVWPVHLESWLYVALAEVVAANLTARRRE